MGITPSQIGTVSGKIDIFRKERFSKLLTTLYKQLVSMKFEMIDYCIR
jgi:hypothetical protein